MKLSALDLDTLLYTLCGSGARLLCAGRETIVVLHGLCLQDARKIRDTRELEYALAKARELGALQLEKAALLKWLKFPLGARSGMLEIRRGGVRLYGGRVMVFDSRQLVILVGAEDKDGKRADAALLDRCESTLAAILVECGSLDGDRGAADDSSTRGVTDLTTERIKRRRK